MAEREISLKARESILTIFANLLFLNGTGEHCQEGHARQPVESATESTKGREQAAAGARLRKQRDHVQDDTHGFR